MRLLYLVPSVNQAGGVAKVLATKTDYFIQNFGYEVHIMTQNKGYETPFFEFNAQIVWHDIERKGYFLSAIYVYKKQLQTIISQVQPDSIIVADNGLKGYLVPLLIGKRLPLVFESHGSKYVNERPFTFSFLSRLWFRMGVFLKEWSAKTFDVFVVLNRESAKEWNRKNSMIIANPLSFKSEELAALDAKKVLAVSRNSYEKGLDRLLEIWSLLIQKYPDWKLDIYGTQSPEEHLIPLANALGIASSVQFYPPVSDIATLYVNASVLVMTSRSEGLGLVLLEAMVSGLPCVAYDCPVGPRSIITDGVNGFLVEDGNATAFAEKLALLFEDKDLRKKLGASAQQSVSKYDLDAIMLQWKTLFERLQ
nr:glycosyltransferase family 4 protein [uncultured Flavobacterium sp.]